MRHALYCTIVHVDHYMCPPLPLDALPYLPKAPFYHAAKYVPVIRTIMLYLFFHNIIHDLILFILGFYGTTPAGQKVTAHVHGILPYFFIRCNNDLIFEQAETLRTVLPAIAKGIEKAMQTKIQNKTLQQYVVAKVNNLYFTYLRMLE